MSQIVTKHNQKTLFACLFCGGAKTCERLKAIGVNALCLSWAQNGDKPKLSKIIPILENLILKSNTLTNAVVVCSEHVPDKWTSMIIYLFINGQRLVQMTERLIMLKYIINTDVFK